jgi:MoxR-like ATPase
MGEHARFTVHEIACYLTERLNGKWHRSAGIGLRKALSASCVSTEGGQKKLDSYEAERIFAELQDLVREKQDLIRQITADCLSVVDENKSISQDDVIAVLDGIDTMEDVHLPALTGSIGLNQSLEGAIDEGIKELERITSRIAELTLDQAVKSLYRERIEERIRVIHIARNVDSLNMLLEKCHMATMRLIARRNSEDLPLAMADINTFKKYDVITGKAHALIDAMMARQDVFYEVKRRALLEYRRQLMTGGFVKTDSVKEEIIRVLSHLFLGIPVFLRGHLGVGKTELALHVCRFYLGVEPEFISGSEEATKYDIYGRTQIGVSAGQTSSFFQEGPLVRAMKAGKPLIIDEMDGIPHSIIMRMNHVLTRRPGDKVQVQESGDEEIVIQKGFCVIATGNVKSARYKREELDAAFLSRWWSEDITYPPQNETYEILTAALIDRRGDLQVKNPGDLDDLKRLTEVAVEIQQIFTGEHFDYLGEGADAARGVPAGLKKSVLSLRHLWNIVRPWKAHNFDKPIEYYILNEFIRPAVAEDQVYLLQLFCRFRFFKNWQIHQLELPGLTEAKLLAFQGRQAIPV